MDILLRLLLVPLVTAVHIGPPQSSSIPSRIWSKSPATYYNDSYLIGNGRVGAGVVGSVASEIIAVNEDSFWSGGFLDRTNPDALNYMPQMQSLIREGRNLEAGRLAGFAYVGTPVSTRTYEALGDIELYMNHSASFSNYERYLDLDDATAGVYYVNSGVEYSREYIASNPADVLAIRLSSNVTGSVSFQLHLRRSLKSFLNRYEDFSKKIGNDSIIIGGHSASATGIGFAAGAKVVAMKGNVYTIGDTILCDNADEAWIYFTAYTTYRTSDPETAVKSSLATVQPYPEVRSAHVVDYQKYAKRVSLSLGNSSDAQRASQTADRVSNLSTTFDPEVISQYFHFGRYLLIASSREDTLPANLQGIWSPDRDPNWGSKYTTNINIQMNYWPSLVTNLADLHSPLNDLIESVQTKGTDVAKKMYGAGGFICHHNTDMWGDAAPQDNFISSTWWPTAGPWLTFHLMEYYRFTGDKNFIKKYYPTLKASAAFFQDFLTDYKGWKVTNPSMSPENIFYLPNSTDTSSITLGPTIDNSLLRELFAEISEIQGVLDTADKDLVAALTKLSSQLPPLRVNSYGGVMEWIEDYREAQPGIDHLSPLWGAYPGSEITSSNATMFNAAKTTLKHRLDNGAASGGWGSAWCGALAARFFDPDTFSKCILHLIGNQTIGDSLLNRGAPATFQIDGNFGGVGAIAEALLQSHEYVSAGENGSALVSAGTGNSTKTPLIRLLPAVPSSFHSTGAGYVKGLLARGGFEVGIGWDGSGKMVGASIFSQNGGTVYVTIGTTVIGQGGGPKLQVSNGHGAGAVFLKIETEKGKTYNVTLV